MISASLLTLLLILLLIYWNRRKTARLLGVSYSTLLQKMRDLGIREGPPS